MTKRDFHLIADALHRADVPFLLVGGLAVVEHGYGRNTYDVDLVIRLLPDAVLRAFKALEEIDYRPRVPITAEQFADPRQRRQLVEDKHMQVLNFWSDQHSETPLDIFVTEPFDFAEEYARSRVSGVSPDLIVHVVTLQTLLTMKRAANRPKDLADIDELSLLHGLPSSYDRPE